MRALLAAASVAWFLWPYATYPDHGRCVGDQVTLTMNNGVTIGVRMAPGDDAQSVSDRLGALMGGRVEMSLSCGDL